ncbi:MAG TPA: hypothetical protein VFS43_46900 [Polyangiaceae bacterium]|nr:hypothetical protein [Polyangiaceae bacterium]
MHLIRPARRPPTVGLALAALVALAPGRAFAAPAAPASDRARALHVLSLVAHRSEGTEAIRLTKALELAALEAPALGLANSNKSLLIGLLEARCGQALLKLAVGREPLREDDDRVVDAACLVKLAAYAGDPFPPAERFVWGILYHDREGALWAKLHAWERGQPDRVAAVRYRPERAARVAERLLAKLFLPTSVGEVRLVASGPVEGELVVGGSSRGPFDASEPELVLPAGETVVEVRAGGRVVARGSGQVVAGQVRDIELVPVGEAGPPGGPSEVRPAGPRGGEVRPAGPARPVEGARGGWRRTAGFVGLGVGAALIGAGAVASLRVNDLRDDLSSERAFVAYRRGVVGRDDPCDAAEAEMESLQAGAATAGRVRRVCSGVSTLQAVQLVFYGASALAVGAGAYLLATSSRAPGPAPPSAWRDAAWSLHPWADASGGGVRLDLTF